MKVGLLQASVNGPAKRRTDMAVPVLIMLDKKHVFDKIRDEAYSSPGLETGGILVGRIFETSAGLVLVVVAASGPGRYADRRPHTYAPDVLSRQRDLDYWSERYAAYRVDYVGEWHKHPPGNRQPSAGDTRQVESIFKEPAYNHSLPYGMYTPIVTIEDREFYLHHYYYRRDAVFHKPERIENVQIVEPTHRLEQVLRELSSLEQECRSAQQPDKPSGQAWSASGLPPQVDLPQDAPPDLEEMDADHVPSTGTIIDANSFISPHAHPSVSSGDSSEDKMEVPPFPTISPTDQIPEGIPLPKRQSREQVELRQFCRSKRLALKEIPHPDGRLTFEIQLDPPIRLAVNTLKRPEAYETPEGVVEYEPLRDEDGSVFINLITINTDPVEDPAQLPIVWLTLTNDQRLSVEVRKLFAGKARTQISPKSLLQETLDMLQQPRSFGNVLEWIEYQSRIAIRGAETLTRQTADTLSNINAGYAFHTLPDILSTAQRNPETE
ncbi:MAG: hypothetical protein CV045_10130 [Cyanobacteria bacterium M5B4]|nr:MAG: hypothetical protein CV045_10130 [Cyanobacteria bacterium M5B4]